MEKLYAKKSLGQNFLVDRNVLHRIVKAAGIGAEDRILEIGPGKGALTELLAEEGERVTAVELDMRLAEHLRQKFASFDNVAIVRSDILRTELHDLLGADAGERWKVVANLPYNISSQVLFRLMEYRSLFSDMVLMLQKEVGDRLVAPPDCSEYGILTVFCRLYFDVTREFIVKPGCFRPVPKVDSVVLKFRVLQGPRTDVGDDSFFRLVVKSSFARRRKTLWNCLRKSLEMEEKSLQESFRRSGIDSGRRGETLSLEEFATLAKALDFERKKDF